MSQTQILRRLFLCLALILSAYVAGFGCWCRDPGPVFDQFERSKSVIVGRLAAVTETEAILVIDRVYKGELGVGDQLRFVQGTFGDCIRGFDSDEIGQQYLFYLDRPLKGSMYEASTCNRSNRLTLAFDDLAYLNKLPDVAGKTRLSGFFKSDEANAPNLEGLSIAVLGMKRNYFLKTDKNGFFEIYDLLPGDYRIEPSMPPEWRMDWKRMFGPDFSDASKYTSFVETVKQNRHTFTRILITKAGPHSIYPSIWFAPINDPNKPDWEILPQEAKRGEVILSKRNQLGILSNFAATPIELDDKRYASVEGFWQMMLYPEGPDDERAKAKGVEWRFTREQVSQMTAFEAKAAGTLAEENMKKLGVGWVTYQGKRFPYRSNSPGEHYRLIVAAMRAKLEQNPEVKRILLATGDLILKPDHIQEVDAPPEWKYNEIWMQLRKELQKAGN